MVLLKHKTTIRVIESKGKFAPYFKTTILLSLALLMGLISSAKEDGTEKKETTTEKKDSSNKNESGPNYHFKNLFSTDNTNEGAYESQLNPLVVAFVENYTSKYSKQLNDLKTWATPYFRMMDAILTSYGIPKEMKYLAVIESNMKSNATSRVGAVGPWQFMPETGRNMGLAINGYTDERTNYYKSTVAAAKYLKTLHAQLGDWLLVIAAYNGGPGRVFSAQRKSGSDNFWELQNYLPLESSNHVKKFIATHYILEGCAGATTSTNEEWNNLQLSNMNQAKFNPTNTDIMNADEVKVLGKYNSLVVAKNLSIDINDFNKLNPGFDLLVDTKDGFTLHLPKDKMAIFSANKSLILQESIVTAIQNPTSQLSNYPSETRLKSVSKSKKNN